MSSHTIGMSTNLLPHRFRPDTYGTNELATSIIDDELANQGFTKEEIEDRRDTTYNHEVYKQNIFDQFEQELTNTMFNHLCNLTLPPYSREIFTNFKVTSNKLHSPQYYNYGTDWINFDLTVNISNLIEYIKQLPNQSPLEEYLKEHFSSYDGFTSFTANNISQLIEELAKPTYEAVGAIVSYILDKDEIQLDIHRGEYPF